MERLEFRTRAGKLYADAAGPEDGPLVMLLHGFPEFAYGWRKQIVPLAAAGFRVVAPDQRGYNRSGKPPQVVDYRLNELGSDVLAIADALRRDRILLAGHDWGGIVGWHVALQWPERVERLAILNAPHPSAARRYLTTSLRQMLRSWYVLFFQLPGVPERLFSARNFEAGVRSMVASSRPGTFTQHDLDEYRRAWRQPGAVTAMINWYRALVRHHEAAFGTVRVPTRILWGAGDQFLRRELARESLRYCAAGDLIEIEDATHWLHLEQPARVNALLIEWFCGSKLQS